MGEKVLPEVLPLGKIGNTMQKVVSIKVDELEFDLVRQYAEKQGLTVSKVYKKGAKMLVSGEVIPSAEKVIPEPEKVIPSVNPKVQMLKDMLGGHVTTAANIDRLPFGEPKERISPAAASPEHGDLVNRFRDILRSASPEGIRVIRAKLSEWEDGQ